MIDWLIDIKFFPTITIQIRRSRQWGSNQLLQSYTKIGKCGNRTNHCIELNWLQNVGFKLIRCRNQAKRKTAINSNKMRLIRENSETNISTNRYLIISVPNVTCESEAIEVIRPADDVNIIMDRKKSNNNIIVVLLKWRQIINWNRDRLYFDFKIGLWSYFLLFRDIIL